MPRRARDESFDRAFAELLPQAYRVAYRILANRHAAEDVAAEALARAFSDWPAVKMLPYRDAWVLRVATNLAISAARRKTPRLEPQASVDAGEVATLRVALGAALRALPRRQREILVLRYLGGLSEAEIAGALGISAGSVKRHAHRALASLRKLLRDESPEVLLAPE